MADKTQLAWLQSMVKPAQLSMQQWQVPASVTLAQCILESRWGKSDLTRECNNYFGVKATQGQAYGEFPTDEFSGRVHRSELAHFAKYPSAEESFYAHAKLLATLPRYAPAMRALMLRTPVCSTYVDFCTELQHCGYSTSPTYAASLLELIREHNLTQYDKLPQTAA